MSDNESKEENPSAPNLDEIEFIQTVARPPPSAKKKTAKPQTVSERAIARIRKADLVHLDKHHQPKKVEFDDKALVAALDGSMYAAQFIKEQLDKFHKDSNPIASMKTKEKKEQAVKQFEASLLEDVEEELPTCTEIIGHLTKLSMALMTASHVSKQRKDNSVMEDVFGGNPYVLQSVITWLIALDMNGDKDSWDPEEDVFLMQLLLDGIVEVMDTAVFGTEVSDTCPCLGSAKVENVVR
jgi:hypothetical protein